MAHFTATTTKIAYETLSQEELLYTETSMLSISDSERSLANSVKMKPSISSSTSSMLEGSDQEVVSSSTSVSSMSLDDPAKLFDRELEGVCSLFKVKVKPGSRAYRYDVDVFQVDKMRQKNLTKGGDE
jgi:hypothetical protein